MKKSAKILVVDDESVMRRVIRSVLEDAGYRVLLASDGKAALKLLGTHSVDLVLTDLVMPEVEGIELIREIGSRNTGTKIIAMSGGGRGDARWYLDIVKVIGVDGTLAKPFTNTALLNLVAETLPCGRWDPLARRGGDGTDDPGVPLMPER